MSAELAQAPAAALKIVVAHHPLVWPREPALTGSTRGGEAAAAALVRAGAHLFLSGHLHVMRDTPLREGAAEALAVTGGTLCTRLRGDPQGFNVIGVQDGRVTIARHGVAAGAITLLSLRTLAFADGWLTIDAAPETAAGA